MKKFWMACALAGFAVPALADGFYVAGDLGRIKWDINGVTTSKTSWAVAGGYKFSLPFDDTLAVELGYNHWGVHNDADSIYAYRSEFNVVQLSMIASHYFTQELSAYGRLGYAQLEIDWQKNLVSNGAKLDEQSRSKDRPIFGVGARYTFSEHFATRLEYTYLKWESIRFGGPSLGLEFSF